MSWTLLGTVVFALGLALLAAIARRLELRRMRGGVQQREQAVRQGTAEAQLQHPVVDLSRCLGCATCVAVCPEDNVLEIVHGQAMVVRGGRCMGYSNCERECPVGAITVTLSNLENRRDVPALTEELEAVGAPGLFLAGEVTAHTLIKSAIEQGAAVGAEVARRIGANSGGNDTNVLDLVVVGAGPAGLACSLEAQRHELAFTTIDQEERPGGTVATYPRRKLVLTQPVDMPQHGRLDRTSYSKEELIDLWDGIVSRAALPIRYGEVFEGVERKNGHFVVRTKNGALEARNVCMAIGRRGSPNKLGVPGEDLPNVAYSLLDAQSYSGRRILVVGGGDSAVETAMALAEQPGNEITLSYRQESFFRIRARNEERLQEFVQDGRLQVLFQSRVLAIGPEAVELEVAGADGAQLFTVANDEVFVMAGGTPPLDLLERSGVSFDPALHTRQPEVGEQGTGLVRALGIGFTLSLVALLWALWHVDYYALQPIDRAAHPKHAFLRPELGLGLWLGIGAAVLVGVNLLYLVRRSPTTRFNLGSLQVWMTSHVATGILAFLCATLHSAMAPGDSAGGWAFGALAFLLVTGAIGRYFYAYVPRAANGRELELAEVKTRMSRISGEWDVGTRRFQELARDEVTALVERKQWRSSLPARVLALFGLQFDLRRVLRRIQREGQEEGVAPDQIRETLSLARRAHGTALMAAHYEDLRGLLATWRWMHRWVAVLMVALMIWHVVYALMYYPFFSGAGGIE